MSTTTFTWTFQMSDGSSKTLESEVADIIFDGDDISNCDVNIKSLDSSVSINIPLTTLSSILFGNISYSVNSGTLISDLTTASKNNFQKYTNSTISDSNYVKMTAGAVININTVTDPSIDIFNIYSGTYTFTANGTSNKSCIIQFPVFSTDSSGNLTTTNRKVELYSNDTMVIYGHVLNGVFGYHIISLNQNQSDSIVVLGDLSSSGSSATLNIPTIGVSFVFSYTGSGSYNCIVKPIGSTALSGMDLRRNSIYGGGATETYTIDNGNIPVSGVNIDSTIYNQSQDYSMVLVSNGDEVWDVRYWCSASGARFRTMAKRTFV